MIFLMIILITMIFIQKKSGQRYYKIVEKKTPRKLLIAYGALQCWFKAIYETEICFLGLTLASSFFGISTVNIPSLCVALIFSASTDEGRLNVLLNSL